MEAYEEEYREAQPKYVLDEDKSAEDPADLAARIERHNVEILAPKRNKTQVLAAPPKALEVLSAHHCIAEFLGCEGGAGKGMKGMRAKLAGPRVARFRIDRYLKYAHLFPELASGLVKTFTFPLDTADSQTAILADETSGAALSCVVSELSVGMKVELEWLQVRVEFDAEIAVDRFRIAEQCKKLAELDAEEEAALIAEFPEPQLMIRKPKEQTQKSDGSK